jgi:predicted nucleic acid-binding protein
MAERYDQGVLDTSVVIDLDKLPEALLPVGSAISSITLAELTAGLHTTNDAVERGARLIRLQLVESTFDALPFDPAAARHYGQLVSLVVAAGQSPRPRRVDLMIAATALAHDMPLYTRNARDLEAIRAALTVVAV